MTKKTLPDPSKNPHQECCGISGMKDPVKVPVGKRGKTPIGRRAYTKKG